jgi:hypothetical protein
VHLGKNHVVHAYDMHSVSMLLKLPARTLCGFRREFARFYFFGV